jgi:hypothetical protein
MRRGGRCPFELKYKLVDVTPVPILTGFVRPYDGMSGSVKMLGRVPARRLITASDVTAFLAHPQMNPVVTT